MNQLSSFACSVAVALGLALIVVLVLLRPLKRILSDVCGNEQRGAFWTIFSCLFMLLSTLLFSLFHPPAVELRIQTSTFRVAVWVGWGAW